MVQQAERKRREEGECAVQQAERNEREEGECTVQQAERNEREEGECTVQQAERNERGGRVLCNKQRGGRVCCAASGEERERERREWSGERKGGQVCTGHYCFLVKHGGFVWAETRATVLYSSKSTLPEAVVCINFILSGVQDSGVVFSVEQMERPLTPKSGGDRGEVGRRGEREGTLGLSSDILSFHMDEVEKFFAVRKEGEAPPTTAPRVTSVSPTQS
ncbi:Hypoxia-inducible factor 1-alpha [Acipenser ruthenus]|uniref:Hypoxia-inducible factor 1-alpha n=1 Tax=Acipenser ruthenus TaxID=7906 RepID=A0A444USP6_ACIRT|nr:Hypoxia-inducible factor 1-alpha [Acipenser ruthenus]